ncbi:MAG: hypothetical protein E6K80_10075 [Candidatus Eisenbacteria bacterium]|uniref:Heavy metal binding domain-containing protein n=1 Tax=Eiseniibacteriota bacterium TaxID=2212470 RepID=A0A538U216_UNCEI|nr:MAG: hypothetical protein E6K80_10075 [Candidatus Eisenbacteria bacterium]
MIRHLVRLLSAALLVAGLSAASSDAHPTDMATGPPTTFPAAVHRIRDEMRGVEEARKIGDAPDVANHAAQLAMLSRLVPSLSVSLASAFADSAVGRVMRAGMQIGAAADATREAAARRDLDGIARLSQRLADPLATLDAYVPKQYVCPMRCEVGKVYDRPGVCRVCGMHLQLVTSDRYGVDVTSDPATIRARSPVRLDFQIKDPAGFPATHLQVVHEKLLHLIVVSYDLASFDHVHPTPEADGRFTLRHAFPSGGRYVLFHDFTPDSVGMQVVPVEVAVEGAERPRATLQVDDDRPKRVDGDDVQLAHGPLLPGRDCALTFTLSRGGKPVTDLEPYLGVMGHLILISEDRSVFLHSHPLAQTPGPSVEFDVRFERTGLYKAWGQFQRHGRVITVPFVVMVSIDAGGPNGGPAGAASMSR